MAMQNTQKMKKWRRILLGIGGIGVAVAGIAYAGSWLTPAGAQPANQPAATTPSEPSPIPELGSVTDYTAAVVATFGDRNVINRQDLGEYLIARYGVQKLDTLINNRIIDKVCRERGITVTGAEVEEKFSDDLKGINVDRGAFVKQFLRKAKKNLYEWKEDVLRQQLLLTKLCRDRVTVSEEEIRAGFEARFGEKVVCRVIHWGEVVYNAPKGGIAIGATQYVGGQFIPNAVVEKATAEEKAQLERYKGELKAQMDYVQIRDSEAVFKDKATHQEVEALAAVGGQLAPFGRHNLENQDLENAAFALQPGQVSPLVQVPDGWIAVKCDNRIPPDATVSLEKVAAGIKQEIVERKIQKEIKMMPALRKEAQPVVLLQAPSGDAPDKTTLAPSSAVATIFNNTIPITRQDLGEFLIARFGAEQLELLVNKRIIEEACKANKIIVSEGEVMEFYEQDYSKRKKDDGKTFMDEKAFIEEVLKPNMTTPYQYRQDVVLPRLQLSKLCRDRVHVAEADLHAAYDAYHGEKVECRMIIWPSDQQKQAMQSYAKLRDNDKVFEQMARSQVSKKLSDAGGKIVIGRHTTGSDDLEKHAFGLQDGDVSALFGTPEGIVVLKCDRHIPPESNIPFDDCRDQLRQEVFDRKLQLEMPVYFAKLREAAKPDLRLKDPRKMEQLKQEVEQQLGDLAAPSSTPGSH